eukprot:gene9706-10736_t
MVIFSLVASKEERKLPYALFGETVKKYGFADFALESGSHIVQTEDNVFHVFAPGNNDSIPLHVLASPSSPPKKNKAELPASSDSTSNDGNQWLAWYFKSNVGGTSMGFTYFSSKWVVPSLPKSSSNLAIFNSLQASYDPTSYNYIVQPVLATGNWMFGSYPGVWVLSAVMCPSQGSCLYSKPIKTSPGNTIWGTIKQLQGSTNSYKFEVNITDITAKTPTQTLTFSTPYFAPMALVSLEHNPAGSLSSCNQLPSDSSLTFLDNTLQPNSVDMWQGSTSTSSCGLSVDIFPYDSTHLTIKL